MRHFEIINENYTVVTDEQTDIIKKQYKKQIAMASKSMPIFRGMNYTGDLIIGEGSQMQRKSANTQNYFTLLTEVLPSWNGWPKRAQSFICTTKQHAALSYSKAQKYHPKFSKNAKYGLYKVIPLENQLIAVASQNDIWYSFSTLEKLGMYTLNEFNKTLNNIILGYMGKNDTQRGIFTPDTNSTMTSNELKAILKQIQKDKEWCKKTYDNIGASKRSPFGKILEMFLSNSSILENLNYYLNPEANDNRLLSNITELKKASINDNKEVWMTGKVLFMIVEDLEY